MLIQVLLNNPLIFYTHQKLICLICLNHLHNYNEDSDFMKLINAQSVAILQQLKCESSNVDANMYVYSADCTNPYLSMKLKERN